MASTKSTKTASKLTDLTRAVRKLEKTYGDETKGPRARKTARTEVFAALRAVRRILVEEYPAERRPRRKSTKRTKQSTVPPVPPWRALVPAAPAGLKRVEQLITAGVKVAYRKAGPRAWEPFAPRWAVEAPEGTTIAQLRKARRSEIEQKALMTLRACQGAANE